MKKNLLMQKKKWSAQRRNLLESGNTCQKLSDHLIVCQINETFVSHCAARAVINAALIASTLDSHRDVTNGRFQPQHAGLETLRSCPDDLWHLKRLSCIITRLRKYLRGNTSRQHSSERQLQYQSLHSPPTSDFSITPHPLSMGLLALPNSNL